jgi:hypothetical protein
MRAHVSLEIGGHGDEAGVRVGPWWVSLTETRRHRCGEWVIYLTKTAPRGSIPPTHALLHEEWCLPGGHPPSHAPQ